MSAFEITGEASDEVLRIGKELMETEALHAFAYARGYGVLHIVCERRVIALREELSTIDRIQKATSV